MKKGIFMFVGVGLLCVIFSGCDKLGLAGKKEISKPAIESMPVVGTLIAKVNNIPIALEDLNQEIEAYNSMVPQDRPEQRITSREEKIDYLKNELIRRALFYQEALDRGIDKKAEAKRAIQKAQMDILVVELVREELDKISVTSKEIEDYYNNYKEQLRTPEERQIREIVVNTEQEARDILIQLLQGSDFATLAKERSKSASAKNGGDVGFIERGKKFAQYDDEAFSANLDVGKMSTIFKGPDGYYIIKLEAQRGGKQKPLSELWDDLKRGLTFLKQQDSIQALYEKLYNENKARIQILEGEIR